MDFAQAYLMCKLGHPELAGWWGKLLGGGQPGGTYEIAYVQTGTGDPSPDNPRPILPGLTLIRDDASTLEVFGGELDAATGILTVTHGYKEFDGTERATKTFTEQGQYPCYAFSRNPCPGGKNNSGQFSHFEYAAINSATNAVGAQLYTSGANVNLKLRMPDMSGSTDDFMAVLNDWYANGTPLQAVYPLTVAETYQLTPAEVRRAVRSIRTR